MSEITGISASALRRAEACDGSALRLNELLEVAAALGCRLELHFFPKEAVRKPKTNEQILAAFDDSLKRKRCRGVPSKLNPTRSTAQVLWTVAGDIDRNWLYVIAANPSKNLRFAAFSDNPGGWPIRGQIFGIDSETNAIADELVLALFEAAQGRSGRRRRREIVTAAVAKGIEPNRLNSDDSARSPNQHPNK